jgi:hypothetical protein
MAQAASARRVEMRFLSTTGWRSPLRAVGGVVVVDSLTAWSVAPWLSLERRPVAAMVHQPPGGVGHHRLRAPTQRWLDLACYRQCRLFLASSRAWPPR